MECTQRLDTECSQVERICPEQIGFLGILGTKYPVMRGPNKIGRDPQTCSIVLNKNSISRQHAVINVLKGDNYMLMDLDSANKTKLNNKTLQAFIPEPLTNGDTVQFGEVFGIFRLLEEETDLPCTQAIDIPETPVVHSHAARVRQATIPESPDVSDKDDSFMMPSQPQASQPKSLSNKFVKSAARTVTMPVIGSNKIDNIFWSSSKKSNSFHLDDSIMSLNESGRNGDIYEAETQPHPTHESTDSIYTAETQLPTNDGSPSIYSMNTQIPVKNLPTVCKISNKHAIETEFGSSNKENDNNIFNAETQCLAVGIDTEQNLFEANTQLPEDASNSPNTDTNVFEANTQFPFDVQSYKGIEKHLTVENKVIFEANTQLPFDKSVGTNNGNIFEAKTQMPLEKLCDNENDPDNLFEENTKSRFRKTPEKECASTIGSSSPSLISSKNSSQNVSKDKISDTPNKNEKKLKKSDEVIASNDLDIQDFLDNIQSQTILGAEPINAKVLINQENDKEIAMPQLDSITDEDVVMNQDDNSEVLSQIKPTKRNRRIESGGSSQNTETSQVRPTKKNISIESDDSTDCEDINMLPTQKIPPASSIDEDLTDVEEDLDPQIKKVKNDNLSPKIDFSDLETQVIPKAEPDVPQDNAKDEINEKPVQVPCFEDMLTQVIPAETDIDDVPTQVIPQIDLQDPDALEFSQELVSPFKIPFQTPLRSKKKEVTKATLPTVIPIIPSKTSKDEDDDDERYYSATQEILEDLCSPPDSADSKSTCNNLNKDPIKVDNNKDVPCEVVLVRDKSTDSNVSSDEEANIKNLTNLSDKQISDIIGVDISKPKKATSDPSDVETTPKKLRPFKFMQTELPDSQEIKTSVSLSSRTIATESSSESENEKESQELTPIVFRKKRRTKKTDVKKDLIANFDVQALPTRIITRTRKPTSKVQESDEATKKLSSNILKPNYLTEQDDDVDKEIISENITRLKSKTDKKNITKAEESSRSDKAKIEEEPNNKRRTNKTLNNNKVIDLTHVDNESSEKSKVDTKSLGSNVSTDKSEDNIKIRKTRSRKNSKSESVDAKSKPERKSYDANDKPLKPEPNDNNTKKETQGKITDYTFSNSKGYESKNSSTSTVYESCDLTVDISKSTRSTRNRNKIVPSENKSVVSEPDTTRRKRGRPKKEIKENIVQKDEDENNKKSSKRRKKDEIIKEPEDQPIRRSTRQKTSKEAEKVERNKMHEQSKVHSISSEKVNKTHEQSTVYNISSESSSDSPKALKRSGGLDVGVPKQKRTRSMSTVNNNSGVSSTSVISRCNTPVNNYYCSNASLRSTSVPKGKTHYVLFTAYHVEQVQGKLVELGAVIVSDVSACSVVLTSTLRRTFKLLCAVGLGRPIVGPRWVQACVDTNTIVDPWQYLLKDEANETRFKFSLARTLAGPRNYLRGYHVSATPAVQPGPQEMKLIVECSGGCWQEGGRRWVAVTCGADKALWPALRQRGATLVSTEFILSGVLKQEADLSAYLIR